MSSENRPDSNRSLSYEACAALWDRYHTPAHVRGHCRAVAHTALVMGRALMEQGDRFDLGLIREAGLLHDIARVEQDHDRVGAAWLRENGREEAACIVEVHMHYPAFHDPKDLTETDLVCLADRICTEDRYMGLDARIEYLKNKHKDNPRAHIVLEEKKKETRALLDGIEERIGESIDALMEAHPQEEECWPPPEKETT